MHAFDADAFDPDAFDTASQTGPTGFIPRGSVAGLAVPARASAVIVVPDRATASITVPSPTAEVT